MAEIEESKPKAYWQNIIVRFFSEQWLRVQVTLKKRNFRSLLSYVLLLTGLVTAFAIIFQAMMAYEGQQHSWVTGFYWTLSTMSTLGYGDINFTSDPGRLFSIVVLLTGIILLLILLPFAFIEHFYEPWMESRKANLVPRSVPATMHDHVILTFYDPIASALIEKLTHFN